MVGTNTILKSYLKMKGNTAPLVKVILVGIIALAIDWVITLVWIKAITMLLSIGFTIKVASGIWLCLKLLVWNVGNGK